MDQFLILAIEYLSKDLKKVLDVGEALNSVFKYAWEIVNFKSAYFLIYNPNEKILEYRTYLKSTQSHDQIFNNGIQMLETLKQLNKKRFKTFSNNSLIPLNVGVQPKSQLSTDKSDPEVIEECQLQDINLEIDGEVIGMVRVVLPTCSLNTNMNILKTMLNIGLISISKVNTFIQSITATTEALVQNLSNGVVMFNTNLKVTLANDAVTRFTGLPKEGYDLIELSRLFSDINLMKIVVEALEKNKVITIPRTAVSRFYYELTVLPITNYTKTIEGGAIVLHDITHSVEVDRAKTEFVSLASHQLRTPLSAIRWYAEMLTNYERERLSDDQKKFIEVISKSNLRMIDLVNSLLNVSRLELGTFAVEPIELNLAEAAQIVISDLKPKIEEKKLKLNENYQEGLPNISADPILVRIIIQNLLSNAVKYTPLEGRISLSILAHENDFLIKVTDTGYGIPDSQKAHMFNKLFRAENVKAKDTDGNGLGMYIVKAILDSVNGRVWFDSKENLGTTFYVTMPKTGMKPRAGVKPLET
jgi:signal transduction histidine kinase